MRCALLIPLLLLSFSLIAQCTATWHEWGELTEEERAELRAKIESSEKKEFPQRPLPQWVGIKRVNLVDASLEPIDYELEANDAKEEEEGKEPQLTTRLFVYDPEKAHQGGAKWGEMDAQERAFVEAANAEPIRYRRSARMSNYGYQPDKEVDKRFRQGSSTFLALYHHHRRDSGGKTGEEVLGYARFWEKVYRNERGIGILENGKEGGGSKKGEGKTKTGVKRKRKGDDDEEVERRMGKEGEEPSEFLQKGGGGGGDDQPDYYSELLYLHPLKSSYHMDGVVKKLLAKHFIRHIVDSAAKEAAAAATEAKKNGDGENGGSGGASTQRLGLKFVSAGQKVDFILPALVEVCGESSIIEISTTTLRTYITFLADTKPKKPEPEPEPEPEQEPKPEPKSEPKPES